MSVVESRLLRTAVACSLALTVAGDADFHPLDLTPLCNQPHQRAFPEGGEGFQGWFQETPVVVRTEVERFTPTPWRPEWRSDATPDRFDRWAASTFFGPLGKTERLQRNIPFRVRLDGNDVVAFDRNTPAMAKTCEQIDLSATHIHLLACGGWWPKGEMKLRVGFADGVSEEHAFTTREWLDGAGAVASFTRGHLFHHVIALDRTDAPIQSLTFIDTQVGPQLLIAAVTLEQRDAEPAPAADDAKAAWQHLERSVVDFSTATIVEEGGANPWVRLAALELQRLVRQLTGCTLPRRERAPRGPRIRFHLDPSLHGDEHRIRVHRQSDNLTATLSGGTPRAVLYAVYTLAQKLGAGFYLGGEVIPQAHVPLLLPVGLDARARPVFAVRGSLPWYNFLNSPTTWNEEDFDSFFDAMVKQRCNFVGFHSYDSEPFAAFEFEDKLTLERPLVTSSRYGWGTVEPMPTSQFGFGCASFFGAADFGSRVALSEGDDETRVRAAQRLLAGALWRAHARGLKTCLGFETKGDPTDPRTQRMLAERLRQMLVRYPMLDYVWLWESESLGSRGWPVPAPDSELGRLVRAHFADFAYLQRRERIVEAVRMMAFARLGHALLQRLAPEVRLVVSGWGGDHWMRFTDFFPGFERTLPDDIIFSALDNIDPTAQSGVSARYSEVKRHEVWPIPWWESDGGGTRRDQWAPQCNVRPFTAICRDAYAKGCQGLLAIHWRTRSVEDVAAYQARFGWRPDLGYEEFFLDFARRRYGPQLAAPMADTLRTLEALGPRWTGGGGQTECGRFSWCVRARPDPDHMTNLRALRQKLHAWREVCRDDGRWAAAEHLDRLLHTADFVLAYDQAADLYRAGGPVADALQRGDGATARTLLEKPYLADAAHALARTVTTRSDLGVLATFNVKAFAAWRRLAQKVGARTPAPSPAANTADLLVPARNTIFETGQTVRWRVIVAGSNKPRAVYCWFRTIDEPSYHRRAMRNLSGGVYEIQTTDIAAHPGVLEWWFEAERTDGLTLRQPLGAPQRVFSGSVWSPVARSPHTIADADTVADVLRTANVENLFRGAPKSSGGKAPAQVTGLRARSRDNGIDLEWKPASGAIGYHVYRTPVEGGQSACATASLPTAETRFHDAEVIAEKSYRYHVTAVSRGWAEGERSASVTCAARYAPPAGVHLAPDEKPRLAVRCTVRGPTGRHDDFASLRADRVLLQEDGVGIEKLQGYGYCWQAGDIGCWADRQAVRFRLTGLRKGRDYRLWLRCLSWESQHRSLRVIVDGSTIIDRWDLPSGRNPTGAWRAAPFTARGETAVAALQNLSGGNAVVSESVLVEQPLHAGR